MATGPTGRSEVARRVAAKTRKSERTIQRILEAAERRFAEAGFDEARIEDIASDAGLAASAVLYHFADKRSLHRAVLQEATASLFDALYRALAGPGDLTARIEASVGALVDHVARRPTVAFLTVREIVASDPEGKRLIGTHAARFLDTLRVVLEEGERAGLIEPIHSDPLHFTSAIGGFVMFYVTAPPTFVPELHSTHLAPEQVAALRRDAIGIAQRLLGPRPARARRPRKG